MKPRAACGRSFSSLNLLVVVSSFFLDFAASAQNLWTEIPLPITNTGFSVISFADSNHGCIYRNGGVVQSTEVVLSTRDKGASWSVDSIPLPYPGTPFVIKCELFSDSVMWAQFSVNPEGMGILRSSDGGLTWTRKHPPDSLILMGIDFVSENLAYLLTPTYSWATTDGGDSWQHRGRLVATGPISFYGLHRVEFFNDSVGYVGGGFPRMGGDLEPQMTTDAGVTWNYRFVGIRGSGSSSSEYCSPIRLSREGLCTFSYTWYDELSNQSFAGLVLSWNRLLDTILIGATQTGHIAHISTGCAVDRQNIWLLRAWDGRILRTTNGGTSWAIDTLPVPISDIVYDLDGHRFALGRGRLFRWNDPALDIEPSQKNPESYALGQNYPNPFNPVTSFQFSIVNRQLTILKVYDVLGREVATLVNEVKQPGTYTVQWDASRQASGVYFYRLNAGNFVQLRKMLLLK